MERLTPLVRTRRHLLGRSQLYLPGAAAPFVPGALRRTQPGASVRFRLLTAGACGFANQGGDDASIGRAVHSAKSSSLGERARSRTVLRRGTGGVGSLTPERLFSRPFIVSYGC